MYQVNPVLFVFDEEKAFEIFPRYNGYDTISESSFKINNFFAIDK